MIQSPVENDPITPLIERIFDIDHVTWGGPEQRYEVRYRGQLKGDSERAYTALSKALKPLKLTPIFREEKGQQEIHGHHHDDGDDDDRQQDRAEVLGPVVSEQGHLALLARSPDGLAAGMLVCHVLVLPALDGHQVVADQNHHHQGQDVRP